MTPLRKTSSPTKPSNIAKRVYFNKGDVKAGFAQADVIVEGHYVTEPVHQAYIEPHLITILNAVFGKQRLDTEQVTEAMHHAASEARTIEARLSKSDWVVGESFSAVDMVIFPGFQLLRRALERPEARELASRFLPVEVNYPALGRWVQRVEALPGYDRTYPPHWRR